MTPAPYDPLCDTYARDMTSYDDCIREDGEPATAEEREDYVRSEEGTYNPANGHFLCDPCYIAAGMPSGPNGWVCP